MTDTQALSPRALRVLLVEDDAINEIVAAALLRKLGCRDISVARDGHQAVEYAAHEDFDLILMDCHMPGMDGYEATRRIRAAGNSVAIVALTADVTARSRQMGRDAGMNGYLTKPASLSDLRSALVRATGALATVPFSRDALLERFGGNSELAMAALRIFCTNTPRTLDRLRAALDAMDRGALRMLAHSVKGSALMIGAEDLAVAAENLERLADAAPVGELVGTFSRVRAAFGVLLPQLGHEVGQVLEPACSEGG